MARNGTSRTKGDGKGRQGGRQKGTPNKVNRERRELLAKFLDDKFEEFLCAWDAIDDPYKKCSVYTDLIPFATPKLQSIELKEQSGRKTFEDELDELQGERTDKSAKE